MAQSQVQSQPWDAQAPARSGRAPRNTEPDLINPDLKVSQAMTVAPRTCSPLSMVIEAAMIFRDANCGVVPVTDTGKPVGVLTDRDVALALPSHENDLARTPVGELMSKDLVTIDLDETLDAALEKLGESRIRRLLVVNGNDLLQGILSWSDLVPHLTASGLGRVVSRIVENR